MGKIIRLDQQLANMIAAGEVVERPMGIVKELVENSIDAKASKISIYLAQGGIESIKVSDNGSGMDKEDALLAFERHATSKLLTKQELFNIKTMGFRGEALPSISSVAKVELQTSNGVEGHEVIIHWGKLISVKPFARNQGTTIIVSNLFQQTPARLKHLKAANYEASLVNDIVQKFALAYPNIIFELYHNDKVMFKSTTNNQVSENIFNIYGLEIAKNLIECQGSDNDYQVKGYLVQPQFNRANKHHILIFINGRIIRNYKLMNKVIEAYHEYMPSNRYPIAIIYITMDYHLVDVNVHPAKWEIRLSKANELEELIYKTVSDSLKQTLRVQAVQIKEPIKEVIKTSYESNLSYNQDALVLDVSKTYFNNDRIEVISEEITEIIPETIKEVEAIKEVEVTKVEEVLNVHPSWPSLKILSQFAKKYLLCESTEGLILIDQHAAHERINYEKLQAKFLKQDFSQQQLLIPLNIKVGSDKISFLEQWNEQLGMIGIQLEQFSNQSIIVRSIPTWLLDADQQAVLTDLIDYLSLEKKIDLLKLQKKAIETKACHMSLKFNQNLSMQEMNQLVVDLSMCLQPFNCPHGRPTLIEFKHQLIEKEFLRIT